VANIRVATREDISYVAAHLRSADRAEDTVLYVASLRSDPCQVWCDDDGTPLAVFGFAQLPGKPQLAVPWLLGTDQLKLHARAYVREARKVVKKMLAERFGYMFNYVHTANTDSIKFLEMVGFTMHEAEPYGKKGELFHPFDAGDELVCVNGIGCGTLLTSTEAHHV
jgi:hypothetical protein